MKKVEFIVRRNSSDELTYAVVKAEVEKPEQATERGFLALLTKALTEWKNTTADGKQEWESSVEDFNVGDLSNCLPASAILSKTAPSRASRTTCRTGSRCRG